MSLPNVRDYWPACPPCLVVKDDGQTDTAAYRDCDCVYCDGDGNDDDRVQVYGKEANHFTKLYVCEMFYNDEMTIWP